MIQNQLSKVITLLILTLHSITFAQINTPRGSQRAIVTQRVGITDISINYSRPSVNGREIWGKLVPYGMNNLGIGTAKESPWRAGADQNTNIEFSKDLEIEGTAIAAGKYSIHMIPSETTWVVIFNKVNDGWGSYKYDQSQDALRVTVTPKKVHSVERLTFNFMDLDGYTATAFLHWGDKQVPVKLKVAGK